MQAENRIIEKEGPKQRGNMDLRLQAGLNNAPQPNVSPFADVECFLPDQLFGYQPRRSSQLQTGQLKNDSARREEHHDADPQQVPGMFGAMSPAFSAGSDIVTMASMRSEGVRGNDTTMQSPGPMHKYPESAFVIDLTQTWCGSLNAALLGGSSQPISDGHKARFTAASTATGGNVSAGVIAPRPQHKHKVPQTHQAKRLFFNSLEEAVAAIPSPNWRCPSDDATVPATDEERQQWVLKLFAAVNNVTDVHDKQGAVFKKRWLDPSTGVSTFYSAANKEILCWDILDLTEQLHRNGPSVLQCFDATFWKQARRTRDWTFQERMQKIIELLTYSKGRCEKLLAGLGVQFVVSNPAVLIAATKGNSKQNKKRQALLEVGRATKKR